MKKTSSPCFRYRIKIIMGIIAISAAFATLFLYKSEELHSRRRLGPSSRTEYQNPHAARLLKEGLLQGRNGTFGRMDLSSKDLYGKEGRELVKEFEILSILERANLSQQNESLAKTNYSMIGGGSRWKYAMRADVRKELEQRTFNGTRWDTKKQACQIPELDPLDESIKSHIREPEPLDCDGIMITNIKNKKLVLRKSITKKLKYKFCYASSIERLSDFESFVSSPSKIKIDKPTTLKGDIPLNYDLSSDFTVVGCLDDKTNMSDTDFEEVFMDRGDSTEFDAFYRENAKLFDVHASIVRKPKVLQRLRNTKPPRDGLGLNVVMLALEATSRMNFIRQLPETTRLLHELGSVEFEGFNIVADATAGTLIPILTGKTELELPEIRKGEPGASSVDVYPMIWKEFAKNGYATMFAEDSPHIATFNLRFTGFDDQPTDHYMRTMWNAAEVKGHCLGPKPVHQVMLDYLFDYMTEYKDKPHFAFSFLVGLTHANINPATLMDSDLHWFLMNVNNHGLLNNTILIIFGDHGSRYSAIRKTLQGRLEERLPFLSVTLPEWFPKRHQNVFRNLVTNSKRLVTPFDIHETLRSVLHYSPEPVSIKQRGISLFSEIPLKRTCDDARVAPHWCTCLTWESANLQKTEQVGMALIDGINRKTKQVRDKCAQLKISMVLHAERMVPNRQILRFINTDDDHREPAFSDNSTVHVTEIPTLYQVTVQTVPGNGLFEGTVRVLPQSKGNLIAYQTTGDISRINRYGTQADCIRDSKPHVMPFCFCKNQLRRNAEVKL